MSFRAREGKSGAHRVTQVRCVAQVSCVARVSCGAQVAWAKVAWGKARGSG